MSKEHEVNCIHGIPLSEECLRCHPPTIPPPQQGRELDADGHRNTLGLEPCNCTHYHTEYHGIIPAPSDSQPPLEKCERTGKRYGSVEELEAASQPPISAEAMAYLKEQRKHCHGVDEADREADYLDEILAALSARKEGTKP